MVANAMSAVKTVERYSLIKFIIWRRVKKRKDVREKLQKF